MAELGLNQKDDQAMHNRVELERSQFPHAFRVRSQLNGKPAKPSVIYEHDPQQRKPAQRVKHQQPFASLGRHRRRVFCKRDHVI
jgi:hypothetical protein